MNTESSGTCVSPNTVKIGTNGSVGINVGLLPLHQTFAVGGGGATDANFEVFSISGAVGIQAYNWNTLAYATATFDAGVFHFRPNGAIAFSAATDGLRFTPSFHLLLATSAPTVHSGFCSSPSITNANGSASFQITIGSSCGVADGVLDMPAANSGWTCDFHNLTNPNGNKPDMSGGNATMVNVSNYDRTNGASKNWTAGDVVAAQCTAH